VKTDVGYASNQVAGTTVSARDLRYAEQHDAVQRTWKKPSKSDLLRAGDFASFRLLLRPSSLFFLLDISFDQARS